MMGSAMSAVLNRIGNNHHHHDEPPRAADQSLLDRLSPRDFFYPAGDGDVVVVPGVVLADDAPAPVVVRGAEEEEAVVESTITRMLGERCVVVVDVTGDELVEESAKVVDKGRRDVNDAGGDEGTETVTRLLEGTTVVYVVGGEPTGTASVGRDKRVFKRDGEDVTVTQGLEATTVVYVVGDPTETAASLGEEKRDLMNEQDEKRKDESGEKRDDDNDGGVIS